MKLTKLCLLVTVIIFTTSLVFKVDSDIVIGPDPDDQLSPELTGFSFTPTTVDTGQNPQGITFTFQITDDLSGFEWAEFWIRSPSNQQGYYDHVYILSHLISGGELDGIYQSTIYLPQYSEAGTWKVTSVKLVDQTSNMAMLYYSDLLDMGFPAEFSVVGGPDLAPPMVTSLSVTPSSMDLSASSELVTFTLGITDELSGFKFATFWIRSPSNQQGRYIQVTANHRVLGDKNAGIYEFSMWMPQYSEAGLWKVTSIQLVDQTSNTAWIYYTDLIDRGFVSHFEVLAEPEDIIPPSLAGITITPTKIDTSIGTQTVTFVFEIHDELSGFLYGIFWVRSPSNQQGYYGQVTLSNHLISGNENVGSYAYTMGFPQYSEIGTWRITNICLYDNVTNKRCYFSSDLTNFPSQFEMVDSISALIDIDPNTLNLKSNGEWITAYIELPNDYDVNSIVLESIELKIETHIFSVDQEAPYSVGDYDNDGIPDLMVKFSRADIISLLGVPDLNEAIGEGLFLEFKITGTVSGTTFEGSDWIMAILPGK